MNAPALEVRTGACGDGSVVRQHADRDTLRIANGEATDAPGLVNRTVDDLVPCLVCFSSATHRRLRANRRARACRAAPAPRLAARNDLRLAAPEANVTAAEAAWLEAEGVAGAAMLVRCWRSPSPGVVISGFGGRDSAPAAGGVSGRAHRGRRRCARLRLRAMRLLRASRRLPLLLAGPVSRWLLFND